MSYVGAPNVGIVERSPQIREVIDSININFHHAALQNSDSELASIDDLSKIAPYLYISCWETAIDLECLRVKNIKCVLNVSELVKEKSHLAELTRRGIVHEHLAIENLQDFDLTPFLSSSFGFIKRSIDLKRNILVHCTQGISNAPAIVTYYLLKCFYNQIVPQKNMLPALIGKIQDKRRCIDINFGFLEQLEDIEASLNGRAVIESESLSIRRNKKLKEMLNQKLIDNVTREKNNANLLWTTEKRVRQYN